MADLSNYMGGVTRPLTGFVEFEGRVPNDGSSTLLASYSGPGLFRELKLYTDTDFNQRFMSVSGFIVVDGVQSPIYALQSAGIKDGITLISLSGYFPFKNEIEIHGFSSASDRRGGVALSAILY